MQYCSLQHQTLLLSPVTSTTGYCFCFGSIPSFFLELFLHWYPVAYWAPTNLGSSSFSVLYFCLFILLMGFSRQEYWSGLPFPSPVEWHYVRPLHHDPSILGGPTWHGLVSLSYTYIHTHTHIYNNRWCFSVTKAFLTLCDLMDCSTPDFLVLHHLLESGQTHVHLVGDALQPSHLLSPTSPALNHSQHQGLFQWISSLH